MQGIERSSEVSGDGLADDTEFDFEPREAGVESVTLDFQEDAQGETNMVALGAIETSLSSKQERSDQKE